jgi:ketosteroid isomerase-like protein
MTAPVSTRVISEDEAARIADRILVAWNAQDVEGVLACYTEDCIYLDPNTRGPINGHDALRKYLTRLFSQWKMHWSRREFFPLAAVRGTAFLWHATLTPAGGGPTSEIEGIDLAILRGDKLSRNEVYFDRMALFAGRGP